MGDFRASVEIKFEINGEKYEFNHDYMNYSGHDDGVDELIPIFHAKNLLESKVLNKNTARFTMLK